MPKVSFYLRNEDIAAWKSIERKTAWVHDKLSRKGNLQTIPPIIMKIRNPIPPMSPMGGIVANSTSGVCKKHGTLLNAHGRCSQKGH